MAYNEEFLIQHMIDHYRVRFPNCNIIIYDNESTDNTYNIAINNNCEIINYKTNNQVDDLKLMNLKSNCWKSSKTDWVLVCDVDEFLDINKDQLLSEQSIGTTIIKPDGYDMVNFEDNYDIKNMKYGYRHSRYDKCCLFNKKFINEINYSAGCHDCNPQGIVNFNKNKYKLYHYKFINPNLFIKRGECTFKRLSDINKKNKWGSQYERTSKEWLDIFEERKSKSIKIID